MHASSTNGKMNFLETLFIFSILDHLAFDFIHFLNQQVVVRPSKYIWSWVKGQGFHSEGRPFLGGVPSSWEHK